MKKINIAELLKDCPKGMELNCTMFEDVKFIDVDEADKPICIRTGDIYRFLTKFGTWTFDENAKCVIFPKGKTTWEEFHKPFKPGDIVITDNNEHAFIYSGENDNYWECYCGVYCGTRDICVNSHVWSDKRHNIRLATEEEKEKLFQVIKDNGYEWNTETKVLKKLSKPEFKDGDVVYVKSINQNEYIIILKEISNDYVYKHVSLVYKFLSLDKCPVCCSDEIEIIRLATKEEKQKLFDAIKAKGYYWNTDIKTLKKLPKPIFKVGDTIKHKTHIRQGNVVTEIKDTHYILDDELALPFINQDDYELVLNKFDISSLKPFDRVLVRDNDKNRWNISFYERYDATNTIYPYRILGDFGYKYCIPYEGNEHLTGQVKDCNPYYKTWINEEN